MKPFETPSRAKGLAHLEVFAPRMGRAYAGNRNIDVGPCPAAHVSGLSPWIRHRLVTEEETVRTAIRAHGARDADKFIQEVLWRTYWKGWLEMRPDVWNRFELDRDRVAHDGETLCAAEEGWTGIEGFDDWARQLTATGWLHNHARMWFASIWIFTLRLPWQAGAAFFMRHLLDADPASNTLSWRWVAGLQTVGKTYLATPENIARFTEGRFRPTGLAKVALPVEGEPVPAIRPLPEASRDVPDGPQLLLVTPEDLCPETVLTGGQIAGVVCVSAPDVGGRGEPARRFLEGALADAAARARTHYGSASIQMDGIDGPRLVDAAIAVGARGIVTAYAPVGPVASALAAARPEIAAAGLSFAMVRRPWDEALWPLATKGFFPFRERSETILRGLGLPV